VDFVDDVNLEARPAGAHVYIAAKLANLVDAAIAGAVDFNDIDIASAGNPLADIADATGRGRRAVHAIQGLGEDAGGGRFADAAGAGEQIGVTDAIGLNGVAQRLRHLALADKLREVLRPIAASNHDILAGLAGLIVWAGHESSEVPGRQECRPHGV
jgi:hypothetical protein